MSVVTLGECLVAMVSTDRAPLPEVVEFRRYPAGAEMNVCVGLARLGHAPAIVARVGADAFGTAILRCLRGEGVDASHVVVDDSGPTGVLFRERRGVGASEVVYHRAGSAGSKLGPLDVVRARGLFEAAEWLHVTGVTLAVSASCRDAVATAVELAREHGVKVCLDVNLRRKLWPEAEARSVLSEFAAAADVVLAGLDEAQFVTQKTGEEQLAGALLELGPSSVVLKLGAGGAAAYDDAGRVARREAFKVATPVDSVGAGDAFAAGWLAAAVEGLSMEDGLDLGNACGAYAVASEGDLTGLPTRAEAERLIAADVAGADDHLR